MEEFSGVRFRTYYVRNRTYYDAPYVSAPMKSFSTHLLFLTGHFTVDTTVGGLRERKAQIGKQSGYQQLLGMFSDLCLKNDRSLQFC